MNLDFCENCNTLLTISEIDNNLTNICKQCGNVTEYKKDILHTEIYKITNNSSIAQNRYIKYDKTLPRTKNIKCINTKCNSYKDPTINEIVLYTMKNNQELKYICINCNSEWQ